MDHKYYGRLGRYTKLWAIREVIPTKKLSMWSWVASFYYAKNGKLEQQNTISRRIAEGQISLTVSSENVLAYVQESLKYFQSQYTYQLLS